ncbi:MAG TPA: metal ABC transporter substrate-binding protein [Rectinemataceae bacterium]|nr:metal ABC transporter substrate-binding protein [Rectinemataceae bacterium]
MKATSLRLAPSMLAIGLVLSILAASCSRAQAPMGAGAPATAAAGSRAGSPAKEDVVAAESFLADILRNVAGDRLVVGTLVPPDTDPHEYQPRPTDFARIREAKAFFVAGAGYEAWLASAAGALEGVDIVSVFKDDGSGDPHFWTDPRNTAAALDGIVAALTKLAPDAQALFAANAKRYAASLAELDARIRTRFASLPPARRLLLTNHDALGHFARAYGFTVIGTVLPGSSTESAPSAKGLSELITSIRKTGVPAIFLDVGENRSLAETVANETGVKVVTDLYIEGTSAADGPAPTYIAMLDHDAKVIADALK